MFSSRIPADLTPNRLTAALRDRRDAGRRVIDLTQSNPTRAGLTYPNALLSALSHPRGLTYRPSAAGLLDAREAVAADYARRGVRVPADRVVLTASTSEAYSMLFKVLADPGDEVLVPRPSYPLFEHLTRLDALSALFYEIDYHGTWSVDVASIEQAMTERTKVVLAVSPNNPTGSYLKGDELAAIEQICAARGVALIVDEVFADYRLTEGGSLVASPLDCREVLAFSLGGLSKSIGLPQAKLGWIGVAGPRALARDAIGRLEFVADTYLSVSTPVQAAAAELLRDGIPVREAIQARISANLRRLQASVKAESGCQVLRAEGGWYGVLQVPTLATEEDLVLTLLADHGILVHPGYFFDFPRESFLVVSLLASEGEFTEGVDGILRHCACTGPRA
jgi:alanine-synthesizing transaminase